MSNPDSNCSKHFGPFQALKNSFKKLLCFLVSPFIMCKWQIFCLQQIISLLSYPVFPFEAKISQSALVTSNFASIVAVISFFFTARGIYEKQLPPKNAIAIILKSLDSLSQHYCTFVAVSVWYLNVSVVFFTSHSCCLLEFSSKLLFYFTGVVNTLLWSKTNAPDWQERVCYSA